MNHQKGFVIPLIISIIAILAIGGGVYYQKYYLCGGCGEKQYNKNYLASTTDVTVGWKTYKNDRYEFQFNILSDWKLNNFPYENEKMFSFNSPDATVKETGSSGDVYSIESSTILMTKGARLTVQISSQSPIKYNFVYLKELINVAQKQATRYVLTKPFVSGDDSTQGDYHEIVYIPYNNNEIILSFWAARTFTDIKVFEKILSSFKFTTPTKTSCTPNWQCGWGECKNGYQGMTAVDSNNCGLPSTGVQIACPALARECEITPIIYCPVDSFFDENCVCRPPSSWKIGSKEKGFNCVGGV